LINEDLEIIEDSFKSGCSMKVLSVQFDHRMKLGKKLNSVLWMIRKKLKMDQFLKVMICQFCGKCFYGSPVWLNGMNSFADLRRLNALHNMSLRIARRDFKYTTSRSTLDMMGRARPSIWGQYCNQVFHQRSSI